MNKTALGNARLDRGRTEPLRDRLRRRLPGGRLRGHERSLRRNACDRRRQLLRPFLRVTSTSAATTASSNEYILKYDAIGPRDEELGARRRAEDASSSTAVEVNPTNGDLYVVDNCKMERFNPAGEKISEFVIAGRPGRLPIRDRLEPNFYKTQLIGEERTAASSEISPRGSIQAKVEKQAESPTAGRRRSRQRRRLRAAAERAAATSTTTTATAAASARRSTSRRKGHFGDGDRLRRRPRPRLRRQLRRRSAGVRSRGAKTTAGEQTAARETDGRQSPAPSIPPAKGRSPHATSNTAPVSLADHGGIGAVRRTEPSASTKEVSARIAGLTPGTTYRFRVAAANANAEVHGVWKTFVTDGPADDQQLPFIRGDRERSRIDRPDQAERRRRPPIASNTAGRSTMAALRRSRPGAIETELGIVARSRGPGSAASNRARSTTSAWSPKTPVGTTISADQTFSFHPSGMPEPDGPRADRLGQPARLPRLRGGLGAERRRLGPLPGDGPEHRSRRRPVAARLRHLGRCGAGIRRGGRTPPATCTWRRGPRKAGSASTSA